MTTEFIDLRGERLAFQRAGRGVPVLLVHSLGTSSALWATTLSALSSSFELIALDCREHGESTNNGGFTVDAIARDALDLMSGLGYHRFHYVGISMGGLFGVTAYAYTPERFLSLTLADSYGHAGPLAGDRIAKAREVLQCKSMRDFAADYIEDTLLPGVSPAIKARMVAAIGGVRTEDYLQTLEVILTEDINPLLEKVRVPTLVMVGEADKRSPVAVARGLAEAIPGARLEILKDAGHLANLDNPTAFNAVLRQFLQSCS